MELHEMLTRLEGIKKGTFVRIVYDSELPSTALGRQCGVTFTKRTEKVVRIGVKYHNIAEVRAAEAARTEPKRDVASWSHWVVPDVLSKHNTKDDYYLTIATVKNGSHTRSRYFSNDGQEVTYAQVAQGPFVLPSYFKGAGSTPVQKIKVENIRIIGGHRI